MEHVSIPNGTRDFGPTEMLRRSYIFDTIRSVFKQYGYMPIETPAMENLSTLMGKYGEEGDRLIFRILNSGDYLEKVPDAELRKGNSLRVSNAICEKALRYDLTVPFARYVVQHRNEITFPFKRYQIQPVWRADRPQKGRYREFYQCDADVVGSNSLLNEVELVQLIDAVFEKLQVSVTIKINNRKILSGLAELIGHPDKLIDITTAIDKLEKIGLEKVVEELLSRGVDTAAIELLKPVLLLTGTNSNKLQILKNTFAQNETGLKGVEELEMVLTTVEQLEIKTTVELDLSLARGLNYYTGAIFEVKSNEVQIGSICGGGRYDNLTGIFGLKDVSGVGISFGADRIYDVLNQLNRYPQEAANATRVLFVNFGQTEALWCMKALKKLRAAGISAELYPSAEKMKKQMSYADSRAIPFVVLVGENEIASNTLSVKDMQKGEQSQLTIEQLIEKVK